MVEKHKVSLLLPCRETTTMKMAPRGVEVPKVGAKEHLAWSHLSSLLKMKILGPNPRPTESESLGMASWNLHY